MSTLIYLEPRDNPEYFFRQFIHDINTNFSGITSGGTTIGGSFVQNGLNTYTGGTSLAQTVNVSALTINNIIVSGASGFNVLSATTFYSGSTPLQTILNQMSGITFSGTVNYLPRFTSGGSINNSLIRDNTVDTAYVEAINSNTNFAIVSPSGFYYPALSFYNTGGNPLGGISAYNSTLYIAGYGAPVTPLQVSSVVQLPYLTGNSLTFLNSFSTIQNVGLGFGLQLTTGGTLSVTGTSGTDTYSTGGTYSAGTIVISNNTGGTFSITGLSTGTTIIAQNGLTNTGATIELGGVLNKTTYIGLSGQSLNITGGSNMNYFKVDSSNSKITLNTGDTSFYTSAGIVYLDIENYKTFRIRNSSIGFDYAQFSHVDGSIGLFAPVTVRSGSVASGNVTLNVGTQGFGADSTVSAIGVKQIAFGQTGGGYGMYGLGEEATNPVFGPPTMRFKYDPTSFTATGESNNFYRIGIGTATTTTHRVSISNGLKVYDNFTFIDSGVTYGYGKFLISDANGNAFWSAITSSGSDTFVTGYTYDNINTFTVANNTGGTLTAIMTGLTVAGGLTAGTRINIGNATLNGTNPESLLIQDNTNTGSSYSNSIVAKANTNNYAQLNITNLNSGNMASSDIVATAANGNENVNFIDMGINSSAFTGTVGYANDAYVYSTGNDLLFGNASSGKAIKFFTDGTTSAQTRMTITSAQTFVNGVFTATTVSATTLYAGTVSNLYGSINTSFTGTTTRMVEAASGGTISATKDLIDSFLIPGSAPAVLLTAISGWTGLGVYTGTSITNTYQGQQFYDSNYYFVAVNDNDWIRLARV